MYYNLNKGIDSLECIKGLVNLFYTVTSIKYKYNVQYTYNTSTHKITQKIKKIKKEHTAATCIHSEIERHQMEI